MTQGHHPVHTGLQKHSVGDFFPYVLVGFADDTWGFMNQEGLYMTGPSSGNQRFTTVGDAILRLDRTTGRVDNGYAKHVWTQLKTRDVPLAASPKASPLPAPAPGRWNWYEQLEEPAQAVPKAKPVLNWGDMCCVRHSLRVVGHHKLADRLQNVEQLS